MPDQRFDFTGARGTVLSGRIERPQTTPRGWAIFAHCFTCGKDSLAAARIARALALNGIGVLRFDFAGLGGSQGEFADSTFAADVDDLIAAGHAITEAGHPPALLIGHSLGGAASLSAAAEMPSVKAVATIGAPADVKHILHQFNADSLAQIDAQGEAELLLGGRPFTVRKSFVDDARQQKLEERIAQMGKPLLVLHAPGDNVVEINHASRIFLAARHPKSFVSLDDANLGRLRVQAADRHPVSMFLRALDEPGSSDSCFVLRLIHYRRRRSYVLCQRVGVFHCPRTTASGEVIPKPKATSPVVVLKVCLPKKSSAV